MLKIKNFFKFLKIFKFLSQIKNFEKFITLEKLKKMKTFGSKHDLMKYILESKPTFLF